MKLTDDTKHKAELPDFWREGWLEDALHELETSNLTPEQRAQYEIMIAGNMSEKYAREDEIKEAVEKAVEKTKQETKVEVKEEATLKLIKSGMLTDEQIAGIQEISVDRVKEIQEKAKKKSN